MTSASIAGRAKSTNWLRSKCLGTIETPTEVCTSEDQQPFVFETLFPTMCHKYGCFVPIFVKKDIVRGDFSKILKRKESSTKEDSDKTKTASSRRSTSRKVTVKNVEFEASPDAIVITARYDKSKRLIELIMNRTNLQFREIMQVIALLAPHYSMLSKIVIQRCVVNAFVIHDLSKMLPLTAISEICLDESPLPEANYATLLNSKGNGLKYLSLARCLINDVVCEQIASKLHYSMGAGNQLLSLNLSSNHITDEGAQSLADALRTNRRLRYLNLTNNRITDTGFGHILNTLTEFPLTANELGQKKVYYSQYLKKRLASAMDELHFAGLDSFTDSVGGSRGSKIITNKKNESIVSAKSSAKITPKYSADRVRDRTDIVQIKKVKTQNHDIEKVNSAKSVIINSKQSNTVNLEDCKSLLDGMGPFNPNTLVEKNGWTYSKGNLELSYLNVAYNDVSLIGVRKLLTVLTYQSEVRQPGETGLIKVNIEGNLLPVDCPEIRTITNIMTNILTAKRSSKTKKSIIT